jgi:hypothetical protein
MYWILLSDENAIPLLPEPYVGNMAVGMAVQETPAFADLKVTLSSDPEVLVTYINVPFSETLNPYHL